MRIVMLCLALVAVAFSGCTDSKGGDAQDVVIEEGDIAKGTGAINGLLIDDAFRPIPGGTVYLFPLGLERVTNENGEFQFAGLVPDTYELRADVPAHEATQTPVKVKLGEFTDIQVEARRVYNEDGLTVTAEYSVFIPCAADFVANGIVANCLVDISGDTYRPGFTVNYAEFGDNVSYLVTEAKINQVGDWNVQVRENDGSSAGGIRYAVAEIFDTDYVKIINQYNVSNEAHNKQNNNQPWLNDRDFQTILFYVGEFKEESNSAGQCCGVGAGFGIKGQFLQTLFIGEPKVDVEAYCVICE